MLDQLEAKLVPTADDGLARNALQEEATKESSKSPEAKPAAATSTQATGSDAGKTDTTALTPNQQRIANETTFFKDLYDKQNFELDPFKAGEGPYQSLERMKQDGKIDMTEDQIIAESRRIQQRDEDELGRSFYRSNDHVMRYSKLEIDQKVQEMVARPKGIDVSNWQKTIDWKQVKDAGYQFAILKATEGVTFVDKTFNTFRQGARDAGLKVGYYHYFHPENPVDQQVKLFCDTVGKAEPDALRLVIDAEDASKWAPYTVDQRVKMVEDFLQGVQNRLGTTPKVSIYCSPNFAKDTLGNSPALGKYSLWIANYGVTEPTLPKPWGRWDFWQYTDKGKVPGINGNVDIDVFNGTDLSEDKLRPARV